MKRTHGKIRLICALIVALMLILALSSCKGRALSQTKLAKTEVGKVGEYSVLYEELYFLAKNYTEGLKKLYPDDTEALNKAIWERINEKITENYAILTLCKENGIVYDEKALAADVKASIAKDIEAEYDGNRSEYYKSQEEVGLTDHYVRFITGVNMLYGQLGTKYKTSGVIPNTDKELVEYIQKNFVHTWHIAVFVNEGDDREQKLAKIKEAEALLENGTSMYELIGSKYNEDVTPDYLSDAYGYYFPRGVMDEKYEEASFSINVGSHVIVESKAQNNQGQYVECFYLIERLSTTSEDSIAEIEKNLHTLSDSVADSILYEEKEKVRKTLSFEPNEFALSLNISELEPAKNGFDYQLVIVIVMSVVSVALVVTVVILVRRAKTRRFQKNIKRLPK